MVTDDNSLTELVQTTSKLIQLDPNLTEYESLKTALLYAFGRKAGLGAFAKADTIDFVFDGIASIGAHAHNGIDIAWGEGTNAARAASSIRAQVRTMGTRMRRKSPAQCSVLLRRSDAPYTEAMVIPAYTQFQSSGNGVSLFTREAAVFEAGEAEITVQLFEGKINWQRFSASGQEYSRVSLSQASFAVSDDDVQVLINGTAVTVSKLPIWRWRNLVDSNGATTFRNEVVSDFTTAQGQLELIFGGQQYGRQPATNEIVDVIYVVTTGAGARTLNVVGSRISSLLDLALTGTILGNFVGGDDEIDPQVYNDLGPMMFSAQDKATDQNSYRTVPLKYPGIVDAVSAPQRAFAPDDIRYANYIKVSALTSTSWNNSQWDAFIAFMRKEGLHNVRYLRDDPHPLATNISANIYLRNTANPQQVELRIRAALAKLFAPRFGLLGLEIARSDIIETITNASPGINYVDLITPTANVISLALPPVTASSQRIANNGLMARGEYQYYVTTRTPFGETLPRTAVTSDNTALIISDDYSAIRVGWAAGRFGIGYNVYRTKRFNDVRVVERMAQLDGLGVTSWTDIGNPALNSVAYVPRFDSSGLFYGQLGTVALNLAITNRNMLAHRREVQ